MSVIQLGGYIFGFAEVTVFFVYHSLVFCKLYRHFLIQISYMLYRILSTVMETMSLPLAVAHS